MSTPRRPTDDDLVQTVDLGEAMLAEDDYARGFADRLTTGTQQLAVSFRAIASYFEPDNAVTAWDFLLFKKPLARFGMGDLAGSFDFIRYNKVAS